MDVKNAQEINKKLFELLKEPLGLHDTCINFTLECNLESFPYVREEYWVAEDLGASKKIVEGEIEDLPSRNNEY